MPPPQQCWYVGDDLRDIQAGQAAGMPSIGCGWGYCGPVEPLGWQADLVLDTPEQLLALMRSAVADKAELAA